MSAPTRNSTPDKDFDQLCGLLEDLDAARFSPDAFRGDLAELTDQLAAHCEGLLADEACLPLMESAIASGDPRRVASAKRPESA